MFRMPWWHGGAFVVFAVLMATGAGCSTDAAPTIDTKATIQKATGGEGSARQSAKAKADSEEASKKHPKVH